MSFASKTHTQLARFRDNRTSAMNEYPSHFQKFAYNALATSNSYSNIYHWSNSQANKFFTIMKNCPYTVSSVAYDLRKVYDKYEAEKVIQPETGNASYAEEALGKTKFNAILFDEYDTWFPAFEAEAKDEGEDVETAKYRWSFQVAKKLSKRTGLSMKHLEAVVGAWLLSHKSA